ncbi:MAG: 16S rRNA (guanine(527)-N(7))-methyltransferase RsmG [Cyanobacteria bacterium REEB459]|nr:16S rRNA (guanine(527)-N(7))-methyltransferase RsmG [Cyanobacteria bacterium REEB459]
MPPLPDYPQHWQQSLHWQPSTALQSQFQRLYEEILIANQRLNLTRIVSPDDFWEKHLWDALQGVAPWLPEANGPDPGRRLIDIGSGGGFPGLPIALVFPHWSVTLLDSTHKKVAALETLCQVLAISNATPVAQRAEQLGHQPNHRETYDLALLRAVGGANSCAEYALPLLQVGGQAVLYRGQWSAAEAAALAAILPRLGGEVLEVRATTTPLTAGIRHTVVVTKVQATPPQFPRAPGVPSRSPLGKGVGAD